MIQTERASSHQEGRSVSSRFTFVVGISLAAGATLALMETASVLSQPGAAIASPADLLILTTWLALPYAILLCAIGLAGASLLTAVLRGCPWQAAFTGMAASAGLLVWLRSVARLGEGTPTGAVLGLLLGGVAAAAGAACGIAAERFARMANGRGLSAWIAGGLTGTAVMVIESRNVPGPFGRALPPPHLTVRLALAAASAVIVSLILRKSAEAVRRRRWPGKLVLAAAAVWVVFSAYDFTRMLSHAPAIAAESRPAGSAATGRDGSAVAAPSPAAPAPAATREPADSADSAASFRLPHVVLISIDTLRADHLSCYGYREVTSPHIDRLAQEGVLFARTASTASFTLPAHASMMTGLFPSSHGATYQNRDPGSFTVRGMGTGYPTLAEILRDAGYGTAGFVSGPLMSHQFGFGRGFMIYDDRYDRLQTARARLFSRTALFRGLHRAGLFSDRDLDSQRTAEEVNPLIESWLQASGGMDRPFFLFAHYWDPHGPYAPPPPYDRRPDGSRLTADYDMDRLLGGEYTLTPRALTDTLALYDGEIRHVDQYIGRLLELLRERGLLDDTLVILTSDHGESFGEHDHWEHSRVLYEDLLHVPFIVRLPGGEAAGTVMEKVIAQPTDILPTIVSVAGLQLPDGIQGRDLTRFIREAGVAPESGVAPKAALRPDPAAGVRAPSLAFAELDRNVDWPARWAGRFDRDLMSARTLRWKYIHSSTGQEELYDLELDPGERINRAASESDATVAMRSLVEAWRRSMGARGREDGSGEIDEGLKENLRSLGYIQ